LTNPPGIRSIDVNVNNTIATTAKIAPSAISGRIARPQTTTPPDRMLRYAEKIFDARGSSVLATVASLSLATSVVTYPELSPEAQRIKSRRPLKIHRN
jgi:hypothetical protein